MVSNNSTDEFEDKKWIMSRCESMIHACINEYHTIEERFHKLRSEEKDKILGRRNNIFSGLGIFLTVILALYTTGKLNDDELFLTLFFSDIAVWGIVYFLSNQYLKFTTSAFILAENRAVESINNVSKLLGYINYIGADLENTGKDFLYSFLSLIYVSGCAELISNVQTYREDLKFMFLTKFAKNTLEVNTNELKKEIDRLIPIIQSYTPHEDIPKEFYNPSKETIQEYVNSDWIEAKTVKLSETKKEKT